MASNRDNYSSHPNSGYNLGAYNPPQQQSNLPSPYLVTLWRPSACCLIQTTRCSTVFVVRPLRCTIPVACRFKCLAVYSCPYTRWISLGWLSALCWSSSQYCSQGTQQTILRSSLMGFFDHPTSMVHIDPWKLINSLPSWAPLPQYHGPCWCRQPTKPILF